MKLFKLFLAGVIALSVSGGLTGCGTKQYYDLPPTEDEKPTDIGTMNVLVIDNTSKPVAGAAVTLKDGKGTAIGEPVETAADGKATFAKVPVGSGYTVTAEEGGVTGAQTNLGVSGEEPFMVTIMLIPANGAKGTIGGSVIDGLTNQPIDGATVGIVGTQTTGTTRADGTFVLKDVPSGNPAVVAKYAGYREARVNVALKGGKLERADLKLYPLGNGVRMGTTVVTTTKGVLEFDKFMNPIANSKRGAAQARVLPGGNLLVASGGAVTELNASNLTVWQYRPLIAGRLGNPQGVDRSEGGSVIIADTANNRVIEVNPGRRIERKISTTLNRPMGVDFVDATKNTVVADTGNNRVIEISPSGAIVWGVGDGTPEILNHPTFAQRLGNGNTLITDTGNGRVMEVNKQQQLVWMVDGLRFPSSAVRLANGNTLITDTGNDRVIEVNSAKKVVWMLPGVEQPLFAERL